MDDRPTFSQVAYHAGPVLVLAVAASFAAFQIFIPRTEHLEYATRLAETQTQLDDLEDSLREKIERNRIRIEKYCDIQSEYIKEMVYVSDDVIRILEKYIQGDGLNNYDLIHDIDKLEESIVLVKGVNTPSSTLCAD